MLLLSLLGVVAALPIPGILLPDPLHDSFYDAPAGLDSMQPGQVYDRRQVQPDLELSLTLTEVWQIAYRTTGTDGKASHTVGTVFVPPVPAADPKLLSYQFYEDSDELDCAPSYSMAKGLITPNGFSTVFDGALAIEFAALNGWHAVVSDHEGPNSTFLGGSESGYAGLDGLRAAQNFLGLPVNTPAALYGYSGGASATVWMNNLADSYAPELNIVGSAHGGTPIDLADTVRHLDRADNLFSGFIVGALTGVLRAYPEQNETLWPLFWPELKDRMTQLLEPGTCVATEVLFDGFTEYHTMMNTDFFTNPTVQYLFGQESLLSNVSTVGVGNPKFPRYIFQADGDEVLPASAVRQYVAQQCAGGANIQYVPWLGNEHASMELLGVPDAFRFIKQAMDGETPSVPCGTPNDDVLTLVSKLAGATIGEVITDAIEGVSELIFAGKSILFDPNTPYVQGQLP